MEKTTPNGWWLVGGVFSLILLLTAVVLSWIRANGEISLVLVLLSISALIAVIYFIALSLWLTRQSRKQQAEYRLHIQQAQDAGRVEGYITVARRLIESRDVLSILWNWSSNQQRERSSDSRKEWISEDILTRLTTSMRLVPVGQVGSTVEFDPNQHGTSDQLRPGDISIVVEPGWRIGSEILKLPIVRRQQ
jgi:membrane protein implicated in regulation of membrane protease activity